MTVLTNMSYDLSLINDRTNDRVEMLVNAVLLHQTALMVVMKAFHLKSLFILSFSLELKSLFISTCTCIPGNPSSPPTFHLDGKHCWSYLKEEILDCFCFPSSARFLDAGFICTKKY